jgi:beta-aspartyl-peptidase (threonine type)
VASFRSPALYAARLAVVGLLVAGPAVPALLVRFPYADREAIRQVLLQQQAAWNAHNLEAFMAGYWHSPELAFVSGADETHGWEETLERYRRRYQGEGREMGRLAFSDLEIEPHDSRNALVRGRWKVVTTKTTLGGRFTLTFRKLPEGWRIVRDETTQDEPLPRDGATEAN